MLKASRKKRYDSSEPFYISYDQAVQLFETGKRKVAIPDLIDIMYKEIGDNSYTTNMRNESGYGYTAYAILRAGMLKISSFTFSTYDGHRKTIDLSNTKVSVFKVVFKRSNANSNPAEFFKDYDDLLKNLKKLEYFSIGIDIVEPWKASSKLYNANSKSGIFERKIFKFQKFFETLSNIPTALIDYYNAIQVIDPNCNIGKASEENKADNNFAIKFEYNNLLFEVLTYEGQPEIWCSVSHDHLQNVSSSSYENLKNVADMINFISRMFRKSENIPYTTSKEEIELWQLLIKDDSSYKMECPAKIFNKIFPDSSFGKMKSFGVFDPAE